jgi:hypothetical protein
MSAYSTIAIPIIPLFFHSHHFFGVFVSETSLDGLSTSQVDHEDNENA